MKKYLVMAMAAVAMVGCTQNEDENKNNGPIEIKFGAGIEVAASRAAIESTDGLPSKKIEGIQILKGTDGGTPAFDKVSAVTLTGDLEVDGTFSNISTTQYFDASKTKANFIAYYPEGDAFEAGKVSYEIDGTQDIIVAPAVAVEAASPNAVFVFKHALARVKLVVHATDAAAITTYGNLTKASINVATALELNIAEVGTTTLDAANDSKADLSFGTATLTEGTDIAASKQLMILPDSAPTTINLTFENSAEKSYAISNLALVAGKITTITVTVNASSITFKSATVEDWVNGGTGGGTTVE